MYGRNTVKCTEMKPWGPIVTTIPDSNRANNCNIFNLVIKMLYLAYRGLPWYGTTKNEAGKPVETLETTQFSKILNIEIILMLKKLGAKFCKLESHQIYSKSE